MSDLHCNRAPWRYVFGALLFIYTATLLTATHWPGLVLGPVPFDFFDKVQHFGAYFVWTTLALLFTGGKFPWRCVLAALALGLLDETTQPLFGRFRCPMDFAADAIGSLAAIAVWRVATKVRRAKMQTA